MFKFVVIAAVLGLSLTACSDESKTESYTLKAPIDNPPVPGPGPTPDDIADSAEILPVGWDSVQSTVACENEYFAFVTDTYKGTGTTNFRTNEIKLRLYGSSYSLEIATTTNHYDNYGFQSPYTSQQYSYNVGGWEYENGSIKLSDYLGVVANLKVVNAGTEYPQIDLKIVDEVLSKRGLEKMVSLVTVDEKCNQE